MRSGVTLFSIFHFLRKVLSYQYLILKGKPILSESVNKKIICFKTIQRWFAFLIQTTILSNHHDAWGLYQTMFAKIDSQVGILPVFLAFSNTSTNPSVKCEKEPEHLSIWGSCFMEKNFQKASLIIVNSQQLYGWISCKCAMHF